jgi:hypothetical protein
MSAIPSTSEDLAHEGFEIANQWLQRALDVADSLLKKLPCCQCCGKLAFWVLHGSAYLCDDHRFYLPEAPTEVAWAAEARELREVLIGRFLLHETTQRTP